MRRALLVLGAALASRRPPRPRGSTRGSTSTTPRGGCAPCAPSTSTGTGAATWCSSWTPRAATARSGRRSCCCGPRPPRSRARSTGPGRGPDPVRRPGAGPLARAGPWPWGASARRARRDSGSSGPTGPSTWTRRRRPRPGAGRGPDPARAKRRGARRLLGRRRRPRRRWARRGLVAGRGRPRAPRGPVAPGGGRGPAQPVGALLPQGPRALGRRGGRGRRRAPRDRPPRGGGAGRRQAGGGGPRPVLGAGGAPFLAPDPSRPPEELRTPRITVTDVDGDGKADLLVTVVQGRADKLGACGPPSTTCPARSSTRPRRPARAARPHRHGVGGAAPAFVDVTGDGRGTTSPTRSAGTCSTSCGA